MTHRNKWMIVILVIQAALSALASSALLVEFASPITIATVMTVNSMLSAGTAAYTAATSPIREVDQDGLRAASAAYRSAVHPEQSPADPGVPPGD